MAWVAILRLQVQCPMRRLGIVACGHAPGDVVKGFIEEMERLTDKPYGVNIMLLSPFVDEVVDVVCQAGVKVVCTGAGNPGKYMAKFKEAGIHSNSSCSFSCSSEKNGKEGADAVVVEGMEAGGHIGKSTTMALLPQ